MDGSVAEIEAKIKDVQERIRIIDYITSLSPQELLERDEEIKELKEKLQRGFERDELDEQRKQRGKANADRQVNEQRIATEDRPGTSGVNRGMPQNQATDDERDVQRQIAIEDQPGTSHRKLESREMTRKLLREKIHRKRESREKLRNFVRVKIDRKRESKELIRKRLLVKIQRKCTLKKDRPKT